MALTPSLTVTTDFTKKFNDAIQRFKRDSVLVGIPSSDNERDQESDEESGPIGNAAILAINHFGSEEAHIPLRPVLAIGIKNAQEPIAAQFKIAAQQVLSKGPSALTMYYERAGIIASNACKKVINDQDHLKPPSPATLKARQYLTQSGFKGTKSLLVTGQMRNAITYVVQSIWGNG
jgi:hypothetical protein